MHETECAQRKYESAVNSWEYRKKHIRQLANFLSAIFSLIGCGMSISFLYYASITRRLTNEILYHFYGGIIVGVILTSVLLSIFPKKFLYISCGVLSILTGTVIVRYEEVPISDYTTPQISIDGALYFVGFTFGITILTYITHCGEISTKYLRGSICSFIQFAIDLGLLIGISIIVIINNDYINLSRSIYIIIGTFTIIIGVYAIITAKLFVYESPLVLLENYHVEKATNALMKLRNETDPSNPEINNEMEHMRTMLENKSNSILKCSDMKPAFKILLCRYSYSLAASATTTTMIFRFLNYNLDYKIILMLFGRFIFNFIPIYAIDIKGRLPILKVSITGSALFLIISILVYIFAKLYHYKSKYIEFFIMVTLIIYNIFLGCGSSSVGYTYMSEHWNYYRKHHVNTLIIILEYAPLILLNFFGNSGFGILVISSLLQFISGGIAIFLLPETKGRSLLDIQSLRQK
ncbi:uncharacterized protein LOC129614076 [Condylostylus longicornis]|uniref:uncharacterized protein LOC129614076 n=1 Tax=Condylostylus longicornis TaxID=2530218 RepID=UPI00244DFDDE|nr:uncharacterized protein LOC129614076 [Condylostylus longicornis]